MSGLRFEDCPWLAAPWSLLGSYVEAGRVPQALLLVGKEGLGKGRMADAYARRLLCRDPVGAYACGHCPACQLVEAGNHPDYLRIEPAEPGKPITVDGIRGLIGLLALTPQYSGRRVVILSPAEQMTVAAANSLLKTLEEPDEHTSLLLISEAQDQLPATIRSRCQRLDIATPERAEALRWLTVNGCGEDAQVLLSLAQGGPFKALAFKADDLIRSRAGFFRLWSEVAAGQSDPVLAAEAWQKHPCEQLVDWLNSWTCDLVRLRAAPDCNYLDNSDLREGLQGLATRLELRQLFCLRDIIGQSRRRLAGQANRQMVLEEILIHWSRLAAKG